MSNRTISEVLLTLTQKHFTDGGRTATNLDPSKRLAALARILGWSVDSRLKSATAFPRWVYALRLLRSRRGLAQHRKILSTHITIRHGRTLVRVFSSSPPLSILATNCISVKRQLYSTPLLVHQSLYSITLCLQISQSSM